MSHKHIAKTHEKMKLGGFLGPQYHTRPFMVGLYHIHTLTFFFPKYIEFLVPLYQMFTMYFQTLL